jgi:hypothetical protein
MIKHKSKLFYYFFAINFMGIFILSSCASAFTWPGTTWTNGGESVSIKMSVDSPKHSDPSMSFGVYFSGNTTNKPGSFTINLTGLNCNPNNLEYTVWRLNADNSMGNTNTKRCNDFDGDKITVSYQNGLGRFMPKVGDSAGRTQYRIAITSFGMQNANFMKFKVNVDGAAHIGLLSSKTDNFIWPFFTSVPIATDSSNKNIFQDLNIQVAEMCGQPTQPETFEFYDLDNYGSNNPNGAQDNGRWNWNGTNGGDGEPFSNFVFKPLEVYMRESTTTTKLSDSGKSTQNWIVGGPIVGWDNNSNIYRPKSFGADNIYNGVNSGVPPPKRKQSSNESGRLTYNLNKGKSYILTIKDLNAENYISIRSTVDEIEKCITDKEWLISLSPDQQRTVFQGTTVDYNHWVKNNGPDAIDDFVDVDVRGYGGPDEWWFYDLGVGTLPGIVKSTGVNGIPARLKQMNQLGNFCDTISANNINSIFGGTASTKDCVHVIDPDAAVPSRVDFEKGSSTITVTGTNINVSNGGACPTAPITIPYTWSIGGVSGSSSFNYGGGFGCNNPSNLIPIPPPIINQLNQKAPGLSGIQYCLNVNNEGNKCGEILVYEVPFARFYGNDVYSTNGQIKFNDSSNDNSKYEERGSVAQYAAFASGANNFLDTAAFRYKQTVKLNPQPPTGLMSAISYLTQNSVTTYNDVAKNLPENCLTTINPAAIPQSGSSVCYDLGSSNVTLNSLNYSNKITIKTTGNIYINGNITNATTAANKQNPANTGVLLLSANNIFIDKGVTRADAILVASESINTCYNGASKILNSQLDELCRSKLVINGSVSANNISFSRVGGSRLLAPLGAGANNDLGAGIEEKNGEASQTLTSGLSAEIINFPAYLYWAKPYLQDKSASGGTVESMFVAPPRK